MSTERKGQWVKMPDGEVSIEPTLMRWVDGVGDGFGYYEYFVPAPDERDAEIAELKAKIRRGFCCCWCGHEPLFDWTHATAQAHSKVCPKHPMRALEAEIARLKKRDDMMTSGCDDRDSVIDRLKAELAEANDIREQQSRSINNLTATLAEAKKPVSVPGRPEDLDTGFVYGYSVRKEWAEELRLYALALESRVRELEAEKAAKPSEYMSETWDKMAYCAKHRAEIGCAECADEHLDTIARVTERATRIYMSPVSPCGSWQVAYGRAMEGEPAHAEAVRKVKAGGA